VARKEIGPLHLVQFYDKSSSWQWLEPSKLRLLGDDEDLDAAMLSGKGNTQRFKNPRLKQECRAAYRRAKAEMELPAEDDEEGEGEGETGKGSGEGEDEKGTVDAEVQTQTETIPQRQAQTGEEEGIWSEDNQAPKPDDGMVAHPGSYQDFAPPMLPVLPVLPDVPNPFRPNMTQVTDPSMGIYHQPPYTPGFALTPIFFPSRSIPDPEFQEQNQYQYMAFRPPPITNRDQHTGLDQLAHVAMRDWESFSLAGSSTSNFGPNTIPYAGISNAYVLQPGMLGSTSSLTELSVNTNAAGGPESNGEADNGMEVD